MNLDGCVTDLAESRRAVADWSLRIGELEKALGETYLGKELEAAKQHLAAAKSGEWEANGTLRAAALEGFATNNNRKPHPAITTSRTRKPVYDEIVARDWCLKNAPWALKLLKGKFAEAAKGEALDFISYEWVPSVSISKQLWDYLEEANVPS